MEKKQAIHSAVLVVRNGKIVFRHQKDKDDFAAFQKELGEGVSVEMYYAAAVEEGTLKELGKIHAALRTLADSIGVTDEEMKALVKKHGKYIKNGKLESLGDMSLQRLQSFFKTMCEVGDTVGCNIR